MSTPPNEPPDSTPPPEADPPFAPPDQAPAPIGPAFAPVGPPQVPGGFPGGYGPPPPPYVPDKGRQRRVAGLVLVGAVVFLGAVVAIAVALWPSGDDKITRASGPLRTPINFLRVESEAPGPCPAGGTPSMDGRTCYRLSSGVTVRQLQHISLLRPDGQSPQWGINVGLRPPEAQAFADLTGKVATAPPGSVNRRIAIVVGDRVVSAPEVQQVIPNGQVQISGQFTRHSAEQLIQQLTGTG